jgi:hypothetical protein
VTQVEDGLARIQSATDRLRALVPGWDIVNELDLGIAMIRTAGVSGLPAFTDAVDGTVDMGSLVAMVPLDFTPRVSGPGPLTFAVVGIAGMAGCRIDPQTGACHLIGLSPGIVGVVIAATNASGTAAARYLFTVTA